MVKRRMRERAESASRGGVVDKTEHNASLRGSESLSGPTRLGVSKSAVVLSRGKTKRAAARERVERKRAFIERELERLGDVKGGKASGGKKTVAPGLSLVGLGNALREAVALVGDESGEEEVKRKQLSAKARKRLVVEETAQANCVREHPAYQSDPVEALRQHLLNTVCKAPEKVPAALAEGKPGGKKKKVDKVVLEVDRKELQQATDRAKENVRRKRERKTEMEIAAGALRKRKSVMGIEKKSPLAKRRGRIGVKRPKILDD